MLKSKKNLLTIFLFIIVGVILGNFIIDTYAIDSEKNDLFKLNAIFKSSKQYYLTGIMTDESQQYSSGSGSGSQVYKKYHFEFYDGSTKLDNLSVTLENSSFYYFVFPKYNNVDVFWKAFEIEKDYGSGDIVEEETVKFKKMDYKKPEFTINCKDEILKPGNSTQCSINITYAYDLAFVKFDLNVDQFSISNAKAANDWYFFENEMSGNKYVIGTSEELDEQGIAKTKELMTFTLTSPQTATTTNLKDNIKMEEISYSDVYTDSKLSNLYATLNTKVDVIPTPAAPKKVEENPKTGVENHELVIFLAAVGCLASVYFFKKKNIIRKI